jgi:hypothetical protein
VRFSRRRAFSLSRRSRSFKLLITTATASITANVTMLCTSGRLNSREGGTKKKSKERLLITAVNNDGPMPKRVEMTTTAMRWIMTTSANWK